MKATRAKMLVAGMFLLATVYTKSRVDAQAMSCNDAMFECAYQQSGSFNQTGYGTCDSNGYYIADYECRDQFGGVLYSGGCNTMHLC